MTTGDLTFLGVAPEQRQRNLRELPHSIEAEQALLGSILVLPGTLAQIAGFLTEAHFYLPVHGRVFAAAMAVANRGMPVTALTIAHFFREDADLDEVGGQTYIAKLVGSAVPSGNAVYLGRVILDLAARRQIIELANAAIEAAFCADAATDPAKLAADAIAGLDGCLDMLASSVRRATSLAAAMELSLARTETAIKSGGGIVGAPTGLRDLDALTGGLHAGEMTVLAARPGMGKTALGLGIACASAQAGHRVLFFTLEMPPEQLAQRILAADSGVPAASQRRGAVDPDEYVRLEAAKRRHELEPLDLIDASGMTVQLIAATARRFHRRRKIGLIVVDYLQLVVPSDATARRNRVDEVTEISAGLKRMARELDVPVLALAQLNRSLESRDNKRPRLSDLRDSGAIEQDADVIGFIHRPIEFLKHERPDPSKDAAAYHDWSQACVAIERHAEFIVEKHRQGPTATIELCYDVARMRFEDPPTKAA